MVDVDPVGLSKATNLNNCKDYASNQTQKNAFGTSFEDTITEASYFKVAQQR